jgi:hypothetical protein
VLFEDGTGAVVRGELTAPRALPQALAAGTDVHEAHAIEVAVPLALFEVVEKADVPRIHAVLTAGVSANETRAVGNDHCVVTPLERARSIEDPGVQRGVVTAVLHAGADPTFDFFGPHERDTVIGLARPSTGTPHGIPRGPGRSPRVTRTPSRRGKTPATRSHGEIA